LAQEQARLTENSVRRVRESLDETSALNRAGLASDYDVLRLEVELANLEPNLRRALNAVQQSRRQLGVELDLDAETAETLAVAGTLATMNLDEPEANSADNQEILAFGGAVLAADGAADPESVERALAARSDVRQLALTESLRKTEMRLEQVEYLPRISFFGNYAINAQQNGSPEFFGHPRAYTRNVGVQVTVPIFQGFQRDARIDQKRAVLRQAETQTRYARSQARSEVRDLIDRADEARQRASGQRMAVGQAGRGFEIARAQYREGLGSQLELTDAEVALRQSEFNYAQAVYDYLVAQARLDEAAGQVPMVGGGQ
jgi:outer membrane protein TolC